MNKMKLLFLLTSIAFAGSLYRFFSSNDAVNDQVQVSRTKSQDKRPKEIKPKINKNFEKIKFIEPKTNPLPQVNKQKTHSISRPVPAPRPQQITKTLKDLGDGIETPYIKMGNINVIHGDILIEFESSQFSKLGRGKVKVKRPKLWPKNLVPYEIQPDLPNREEITKAIDYLHDKTNIRFVRRKAHHKNWVLFTNGKANCYSSVGMIGGKQKILLASGCKKGHILHELLHTLGLFHEQNRPDRDNYIAIYWHNIDQKHWPQFQIIPKKYMHSLLLDPPFDFKSIMLYPVNAFAKDPRFATMSAVNQDLFMPESEKLSFWDLEKINALYPPQ